MEQIKERNLLSLILLSLVTLGIYGIYFWYKYTEDMNAVCAGDGKESKNFIVVILLSIITCGIYMWFWLYGIGNRLNENASKYNLTFQENGTTIMMWMIFGSFLCGIGSFVATHILIKNMNAIAVVYNQRTATY